MRIGGSFFVEHIADLNRRSVCAQNIAVFNVERILHGARRVVCGDVQGLEVVEIVFDFRAIRHFKTHTVKEFHYTLQSQGYGMQTAVFLRASGQGNIECFGASWACSLASLSASRLLLKAV